MNTKSKWSIGSEVKSQSGDSFILLKRWRDKSNSHYINEVKCIKCGSIFTTTRLNSCHCFECKKIILDYLELEIFMEFMRFYLMREIKFLNLEKLYIIRFDVLNVEIFQLKLEIQFKKVDLDAKIVIILEKMNINHLH